MRQKRLIVRTEGWAQTAAHGLGTPEGWDLSPPPPGQTTRWPLTPPPRKFSCLEPQSKTKGRGGEGAAVPSNHGWLRTQSQPSRGSSPRSPLAADQGLGNPRSLVSPRPLVTGAGEAAEGQPGMGKPDGSFPPPSSSIPPSGSPRPGRPPQGPGEAAGPARPGSPQGKGCLCLKVTTRARCPGWAWYLPFPGRGGGDGGPPQVSGGDRGKTHLPPFTPTLPPRNGPLRDWTASGGGGSTPFSAGEWGTKSAPFIV